MRAIQNRSRSEVQTSDVNQTATAVTNAEEPTNMHTKAFAAASFAAAMAALGVITAPTAAAADLVGPGCADYAAAHPTGPASVEGMSQVPVVVAASNNPVLTTLTAALSGKLNPQVNLVDTLNSG